MISRSRSNFPWDVLGVLVLLSCTLAATKWTAHRKAEALAQPLDSISRDIKGFTGSDNPPLTPGVLAQLKCSSYLVRTYTGKGVNADVFIAYYAEQRAGESMHSPKHCLPGSGWEIWDYGSTDIEATGQRFKINKYSIQHSGERRLVLYWYQSKGRIIASEYTGKILLAKDAFLQNSTAGSIVRIIVPDRAGALEDARGLASDLIVEMRRAFGE